MAAGDSAARRAVLSQTTADRYRVKLERAERSAGWWSQGQVGEQRVVEHLAPLSTAGYFHLDDRRRLTTDGNLDCVVIGPPGVVLIDSKNWTGDLAVVERTLRQNGRRRDSHVETVRAMAVELAEAIDGLLPNRIPVWPVMCFVGSAAVGVRTNLDRVHLVDGPDLAPFIGSLAPKLDGPQVETVLRRLLDLLPQRGASDPAAEVPEPSETVVFLEPWKRLGKHRLYVKDSGGRDLGHLDLLSGNVRCDDERWRPTLNLLLPHYLSGDSSAVSQKELSSEARKGIRRFLDSLLGRSSPILTRAVVVACHWRKYGKNRLYVDRITPQGKKEGLGWYDLVDRQSRPETSDDIDLVAFCGRRFASLPGAAPNRSKGL